MKGGVYAKELISDEIIEKTSIIKSIKRVGIGKKNSEIHHYLWIYIMNCGHLQ